MKKLLLLAACGVAGLMSANKVKNHKVYTDLHEQNYSTNLNLESRGAVAFFYTWYRVNSPCGKVYYLDLDQYTDDYAGYVDFLSDIGYFNYQKCGETGLDQMF